MQLLNVSALLVIVCFITFSTFVSNVESFSCFVCDSRVDSGCWDPFRSTSSASTCRTGICAKDRSGGFIRRYCAAACYPGSYVKCCYRDLCNSSPSSMKTSAFSSLFIGAISTIIYFKY